MVFGGSSGVFATDGRLPRWRWMYINGHPGWSDAAEGSARCGLVGLLLALLPGVGDERLRANLLWLWLGSTRCMAMLAGSCSYLRKVPHLWCVRGLHFVADPSRTISQEWPISMANLLRAHPNCSRCSSTPQRFPWETLHGSSSSGLLAFRGEYLDDSDSS